MSNWLKGLKCLRGAPSSNIAVPPSLLPFGLPPTCVSSGENLIDKVLREQMEEKSRKLKIHAASLVNRHIPLKMDISALYSLEKCPIPTSIKVDRDPVTGRLIGYHEEKLSLVGETARNSCSLMR